MRRTLALSLVVALPLACSAEEAGLFQSGASGGSGAASGDRGGNAGMPGGHGGGDAGSSGSSTDSGGPAGSSAGGTGGNLAGSGGSEQTGGTGGSEQTGGSGAGGAEQGGVGSGGEGGIEEGGAGGGPNDDGVGVIRCGTSACQSAIGEMCCRQQDNVWCEISKCTCEGFACQADSISCDGPEDCPGQVCCHDRSILKGDVSCEKECEGGITGGKDVLCDPMAPDPCGDGKACVPSTALPQGFFICD